MLKTVAYVIRSFPEPSETFIAEEAASLISAGIQPCVIHLYEGKSSVVHPAARTLLEQAPRLRVTAASAASMAANLGRWLTVAPIRTLRTLGKALHHPDRWCYFQSLGPAWWCREQQVDFLHAHFADINFLYAACMSEWSGIPFGVTTHRYDLLEEPLGKDGTAQLYQSAHAVVTISEFNRQFMQHQYSLSADRIHIVHCGIATDRFAFIPRTQRANGSPFRLLNVGRLAPQKGQDVLLQAMAMLKDRHFAFHLDIVGAGELEQGLKSQAAALGLGGLVTFHGAQAEHVVRQLHQQADAFVLSSRAEGLPVVCIEALALGTSCIATNINGIPELIQHGVNGMLVEAEDPAGLADMICQLQADPASAQRLRHAGRSKVLDEFDRRTCTEQLIGIWSRSHPRH